jgi:hypothetical protein
MYVYNTLQPIHGKSQQRAIIYYFLLKGWGARREEVIPRLRPGISIKKL